MKTTKTKTVVTVKKGSSSRTGAAAGSAISSGNKQVPTTITREISNGQSGLRHSLRGSGKVWKKTVLGKKFEFAEKLKEKKNYIMYSSGTGHEKKVIEEIEQIPQPEKIIEERQVIDNYEYHETKDLKKKKDPRRLSVTVHQRLSSPFERTVLKKYSSSISNQQPRSYTSKSTTKKTNYGEANGSLNKYNSFTTKQDKNKTVAPSKLYETYKPSKNASSYMQKKTITTIKSENKAPIKTTVNQYQIKTITSSEKSQTNNSKYEDRRGNAPKYIPKNAPKSKYNRPETEPNFVGEEQTKTETTQDGDYLIKVTTTKKQVSGMKPYGGRRHGGYPGQKPRMGNNPRGGQKPGFGEEPGKEEEKEKPNSSNRPTYGGPRSGFGGLDRPHGFGGPHGPHGFGGPHGPHGFGGPHGPHGFGGHHGPHGFGGPRPEDRDNRPSSNERPKSFDRPGSFTRIKPGEGPRPTLEGTSSFPRRFGTGFGPHGPGFGPHGPGFGPHGPGFGPHGPGFGPHGPGFGPHGLGFEPGPRPVLPPRPGFGPHGPGFGAHGPGFGPHGPGFGPRFGPSGFGPRPVLPPRPGFRDDDGIIHYHLPTCPLNEEERRRAQSLQTTMRAFEEKTFSQNAHRPFIGGNYGRYSSEPKYGKNSIGSMEKRNMTITTQKKTSNIGGTSQFNFQTTRTSDGGDNYNYYESKNILKKHRRLPITIHHRRGQLGAYRDDIPDRPNHRGGSYNKTKISTSKNTYSSGNIIKNLNQNQGTNLNKTYSSSSNIVKNLNKQKMGASSNKIYSSSSNIVKNINKPKMIVETSAKTGGSKYTQKSSYKQVQTSSGKSSSGFTKGTGRGSSSYSEYKKYEQKGKMGSSSSVGNLSKYQFKQNANYNRSKMDASAGETSYKYSSNEYREEGPSYGDYDEQYHYTESNEYRYGGNDYGDFSQYQYLDDSQFEVIECPVHGKQTVRRNRYYNYY